MKNQYQSTNASQTPQRQKILDQLRNDVAYLQRADFVLNRARLKVESAFSFLYDIDDLVSRQQSIVPQSNLNGPDTLAPDLALSLEDRKAAYDIMMIRSLVPTSYSTLLPYIRQKFEVNLARLFQPIVIQRPPGAQGPEQVPEVMTNLSAAFLSSKLNAKSGAKVSGPSRLV